MKQELQFTADLIQRDVRNNSAWNHRHWVLTQLQLDQASGQDCNHTGDCGTEDCGRDCGKDYCKSEFGFVFECIKQAVSNYSAWNYLLSLLKLKLRRTSSQPTTNQSTTNQSSANQSINLSPVIDVLQFFESVEVKPVPYLSFLVDLYDLTCTNAENSCNNPENSLNNAENNDSNSVRNGNGNSGDVIVDLNKAANACATLCEVDPIRKKYWNYRLHSLIA